MSLFGGVINVTGVACYGGVNILAATRAAVESVVIGAVVCVLVDESAEYCAYYRADDDTCRYIAVAVMARLWLRNRLWVVVTNRLHVERSAVVALTHAVVLTVVFYSHLLAGLLLVVLTWLRGCLAETCCGTHNHHDGHHTDCHLLFHFIRYVYEPCDSGLTLFACS